MKKIEVSEDKLLYTYSHSTDEQKILFEVLYGKEVFTKPRLPSTWEEVCKIKQLHPIYSLPYTTPSNEREVAINAFFIIDIVREVLNTDSSGKVWEPDWSNASEYKYWLYFKYTAGVGFSFYGTYCGDSGTGVGSRLCFKTKELAEYAGMAFIKYYRDLFTL